MQCKWGSHGDYEVIALAPFSVQEMFDLTIDAFNYAEQYRIPVFVMGDGILAHLRERLVIPKPEEIKRVYRKRPKVLPEEYLPFKGDEDDLVPPMALFGEGYHFYATGLTHDERGYPDMSASVQERMVTRLCDKIRKNVDKIVRFDNYFLEDADVIVISYGTSARSCIEAVKRAREHGIKAGMIRLVTLWPFPEKQLEDLCREAKAVIVAEMNYGQIVREVERAIGKERVRFTPKLGEDPHRPDEIMEEIRRLA